MLSVRLPTASAASCVRLNTSPVSRHITLTGTPNVNMQIKPEVNGGIGTIAMCVNMIPHVLNATPGLKTMIDLPVPHAIMGDMRNYLNK